MKYLFRIQGNYHTSVWNRRWEDKLQVMKMGHSSVFAMSNHGFHSSRSLKGEKAQEVSTATTASNEQSKLSPKLEKIVNDIATLNLLEVTQLVSALKTKLNLPDVALMGAVSVGAAHVAGAAAGGSSGAASKTPAKEGGQIVSFLYFQTYVLTHSIPLIKKLVGCSFTRHFVSPEQTIFTVILKSFDKDKKVTVIKEVKNLLKLGLKEAKELVEKAPVKLQENCPKVEAEAIRDKLKEFGGEIVLE
ncbi:ribosomal protein L7/L12 [Reticulomyxa filosa]|uniref:Ribosomal protein L7/L12 n=1 Tax=Reticulomyxa filosa TaxID=46433 RepID=X6LVJ3_RETFI|nr:ribosomal protein L7/L12 [Reticulomyxa filosa]|eukprot:ETO04750.1 ribosomal protein L7/L12 [Reticulomyxa filosa]